MTAESAMQRGRAAALLLMVDTCVITRVTGQTTNTETGVITPTTATIYAGKCRVQQRTGGVARPQTVGEGVVYQLPLSVQLPMSAVGFQVGDVVTVTASALDPDLPGRKFWVRELAHKTHATARRLGVEEVTS